MPSTSRVYTVGQVLTAAQMNDLPQGILTKNAVGTDQGPTSGTTELDVNTANAVTIAGTNRRIRITFHARSVTGTVTNDVFVVTIREGATLLGQTIINFPSGTTSVPCFCEAVVDSPTAASHTYKATVQRTVGTGTATVNGTTQPSLLLVEDVGIV